MKLQKKSRQISLATFFFCVFTPQVHAGFLDDMKTIGADVAKQVIGDTINEVAGDNPEPTPKQQPQRAQQTAPSNTYQKPQYDRNLVANTQSQLNRLGYNVGAVDGLYGNGTKRAIERFQLDQRIAVNGTPSKPLLVRMEMAKASEISTNKMAQTAQIQTEVTNSKPGSESVSSNSNYKAQKIPTKTEATNKKETSPKQSNGNIAAKTNALPQKPLGAEETTTDLYLSMIRLRPDLLDKVINPHKNTTLLDVILLENPERYGLDKKTVSEFKNNEFTHNKRYEEYKKRVINAASNAPMMYRRKVEAQLTKYNFEGQEYGINKLELATIYDGPFIRLFEGFKAIEALEMSPEEAEALKEWYQEGFNKTEYITGFWNYKIKSIRHTSEFNTPSWTGGRFVAEVEPGELVLYGRRAVESVKKSGSPLDPIKEWRRQKELRHAAAGGSSGPVEYKKIAGYSLKKHLGNNSLDVNKLPSFDIVGIKSGASIEEVMSAIKSHNTDLVMRKKMKSLNIPESLPYVSTLSNQGGNRVNSLDQFKIWFSAPPFNNTVTNITRNLNLKDKASPLKAIVASLEKKYGKPDKSIKHRSSNNRYYDHEYTWLEEAGQLTVILGIREGAFVERMTFRTGLSVNNQHDITSKYERNQQLWRSYHKGKAKQQVEGNVQTENVPAF